MKLKFELFLDKHNFSSDAKALFNESLTCFKFSAYRASLIMAYIGFMELIREKLILSEPANGYTNERWRTDILHKIKKEECWDKEVFEILIRTKNPIFNISEGLKTQLYYWKDRRNDCAHYKKNNISQCHIEAFLEFIESNIDKFVVNDSVDFVINEIKDFFTETYKEKNIDILISKIFIIFNEEMFEEFLNKIILIFSDSDNFKSKIDMCFSIFGGVSEEVKIILLELLLRVEKFPTFDSILKNIIKQNNELYLELCEYDSKFYSSISPTNNILEIYYINNNKNFDSLYRPTLFKYFIKSIPKIYHLDAYKKFLNTSYYISGRDLKENSILYDLHTLKEYIILSKNFVKIDFEWMKINSEFILVLSELLNFDDDVIIFMKKLYSKNFIPEKMAAFIKSNYPSIYEKIRA